MPQNRSSCFLPLLKFGGSAHVAEICTGHHNRLLRRQHCSSLCSQSEGHEHVANMASAPAMSSSDIQPVLGHRNIPPPRFASKVSYSVSPRSSAAYPMDMMLNRFF